MTRARLPDRRRNETREIAFDGRTYTLCAGFYDNGQPGEVFLDGHKTGSTMQAFIIDACIGISKQLQHGISRDDQLRSASKVPVWISGEKREGPASAIGAILEALEPIETLPWAA
jgi:hypothetical protein